MEPSQNRDSVSLICLVTRQRYKFPQHLCCLRSWKGKGKKRLEVGVTPSSLRPEQRGGALGENRGDRRHPAPLRGQQAASKCRQPENMVWRALGSRERFNGDIFNSLCTRRAPFLMACTKANPALTYNLPNSSCPSLLSSCCRDRHLPGQGGRSGDKAEPELKGPPTPPQPRGQLQPGDTGGKTQRGVLPLLPPHEAAREENGYKRGRI